MYYTINNSDEVTLTLNLDDLLACFFLISSGICNIHSDARFNERIDFYRELRDKMHDAVDEMLVWSNPDFMKGDK